MGRSLEIAHTRTWTYLGLTGHRRRGDSCRPLRHWRRGRRRRHHSREPCGQYRFQSRHLSKWHTICGYYHLNLVLSLNLVLFELFVCSVIVYKKTFILKKTAKKK